MPSLKFNYDPNTYQSICNIHTSIWKRSGYSNKFCHRKRCQDFCYLQRVYILHFYLYFLSFFYRITSHKAVCSQKHVQTFSLTTMVRFYPYYPATNPRYQKCIFFFFFCFYNGSKDLLATWKIRCQNDEDLKIYICQNLCAYITLERT